ncbi:MAG: PEP-CTERM sorting domain-containing protein [Pseudomonadota bacterium]
MKLFKLIATVLASFVIASTGSAAEIYQNGSLNGTFNADSITPPQSVSDSFIVSSAARVTAATIGLWTAPGTLPATLSYSFGTSAFASDRGFGTTALTSVYAFTNNFGLDVYLSSFAVDATFAAGEYWLTLGNGFNDAGGSIFWDINFGPSQSQFSNSGGTGSIDSHYFLLTGDATTDPDPDPNPQPVPEPASLMLLAAGIIGVAASRRRRSLPAA